MTHEFDPSYYEDLRGRVRGVLISVAENFPTDQLALLEELIDANEPGIALEMLGEMLVDAKVALHDDVMDAVAGLVETMGLDRELIQQLRTNRGPSENRP